MAVVQISKIQVRRGQEAQTGIPQLAGGEFAWAEDTENLYIGLKREDGGARDTNIRVLTENDIRLFNSFISSAALATYYTWEIDSSDTITSTATIDTKVIRSVQNKLDDFVNIADFGVIPLPPTDDVDYTIPIQMAIDHLFLDQDVDTTETFDVDGTLQYNKKLYFPAGIYKVGGTIFIPRNTVIVGEGVDKTIIENSTTGSGVFQTIDYDGRRTDSSLGKFDASTGSSALTITGSGQPNSIHIEGMTLRYSTSTGFSPHLSLISLDCVDGGTIRDVKLEGRHASWPLLGGNLPTGIDIRGYNAVTSENILIENCEFSGLYYGVKSNYDTNHIVIQNNSFKSSSYGIAFSTASNLLTTTGPSYSRAVNNKFQSIDYQGIYIGTNTTGESHNFVSENNSFINVGNTNGGTELLGVQPVIIFSTPGNVSINDYFGRQSFHNSHFNTSTIYYPLIQGRATLDTNSISTGTLSTSTSTAIMRLPITGAPQYLNLKYNCSSLSGETVEKTGVLDIYVRGGSTPSNIQLLDNYNTSGSDGGIYWGVVSNPATKSLDIIGVNPSTSTVSVSFQTKIML